MLGMTDGRSYMFARVSSPTITRYLQRRMKGIAILATTCLESAPLRTRPYASATCAHVVARARAAPGPDSSRCAVQILARNPRNQMMECFGDPALAAGVIGLLSDPSEHVCRSACLAICNLGVVLCPARVQLLERVRTPPLVVTWLSRPLHVASQSDSIFFLSAPAAPAGAYCVA